MTENFSWSRDTAAKRLADTRQRVAEDTAETRHVFTQLFCDDLLPEALPDTPLSGALVSIKDLLDVEGYTTRAGTVFMADNPPAERDAEVVSRLRAQGCVFVGHTNMTELAYSGLGLNPHYGTPENARFPGCIPGGSTSGGAVSVAQGFADFTIGTDTGGSLRIPAAFNGITGFKPSQSTASHRGCYPLSRSLDSIGPMARDVATCRTVWQAISEPGVVASRQVRPEFVIPENFGTDDMEPVVASAFDTAIAKLQEQGYSISTERLSALDRMKDLAVWQFSAVESRAVYNEAFTLRKDGFDPRVASRMARADEATAISYRQLLDARAALIPAFEAELDNRILLMPTVPILPPKMSVMEDDEAYSRLNLLVLRNPTVANVMNGCSLSLPFSDDGNLIGVMLTAANQSDLSLLDFAARIETALAELALPRRSPSA